MNAKTNRRVLLVDDSPLVRAVVAHELAASGIDVRAIDDPRQIDEAVVRESPELMLVDATFPGVSDDVLVAALAKHASGTPVLIFSDRAQHEIDSLVGRTGARGAVPKDGKTLAARLTEFLDELG